MKKRFFLGLTGLAIMAAAITAVFTSADTNSTQTNLLSKNIEALSRQEGSIDHCAGEKAICITSSGAQSLGPLTTISN